MSDVSTISKAQLPTDSRIQCPACGTPVEAVTLEVRKTPAGGFGLLLDGCGHLCTLELLRDAWGIDIPDPMLHFPQTHESPPHPEG